MNDFPRWRYWLVAVVMVLGVVYALPNAFLSIPGVQVTANRGAAPVDSALQQKVVAALATAKVASSGTEIEGDHLLATFVDADTQRRAAEALQAALGDGYTVTFKPKSTVPAWLQLIGARSMPLGLDLQGGVHFLMQVDQKETI
ncbi:MAG: protein translocase subunit SecD, partial [Rhodanobacter sp.]